MAANLTASNMKRKGGQLEFIHKPPKIFKPSNWRESHVIEKKPKAIESLLSKVARPWPRPLERPVSETFARGCPLADAPKKFCCKHCKKAVLYAAAIPHIARCLQVKKEKAQRKKLAREQRERERAREAAAREEAERVDGEADGDGDGDGDKVAGKTAGKTRADGSQDVGGKKRKADGDDDGKASKRQKKKDELKPKAPKTKGPVDVERQCGVPLPNGQLCARSLTCKSHSMGAKRAVAGRSMPYDMLLAAYQKKNQAKLQQAAIDANAAPLLDDDDANNGPIDEEEEARLVKQGLEKWRPIPVVPDRTFAPLRFEYKRARIREALDHATNGGRINIFKVTGLGAQKIPTKTISAMVDVDDDAPGEPDLDLVGQGLNAEISLAM